MTEIINTKCSVCSLTLFETFKYDKHDVCIMCSAIYRCCNCGDFSMPADVTKVKSVREYYCGSCKAILGVSTIIDGVYLSNNYVARQYPILKSLGIERILTIGSELTRHETNEFELLYIPIDDHPDEDISRYFEIAHAFINRGPTLVHCYAGISRSATLVISYLMNHYKMDMCNAISFCKKRRPIINPNQGFLKQLAKYEHDVCQPVRFISYIE